MLILRRLSQQRRCFSFSADPFQWNDHDLSEEDNFLSNVKSYTKFAAKLARAKKHSLRVIRDGEVLFDNKMELDFDGFAKKRAS